MKLIKKCVISLGLLVLLAVSLTQPVVAERSDVILLGDANADGQINSLDITKVERIIAGLDSKVSINIPPNVPSGATYFVGINTADDGVPGSTGYWVKRGPDGEIVRATTDNYSDDDIQYAIDSLPSVGQIYYAGTVELSVGVFYITPSNSIIVRNGLTLQGQGPMSTRLSTEGGNSHVITTSGNQTSFVTIRDLQVVGSGWWRDYDGIYARGANRWLIDNVWIYEGKSGIEIEIATETGGAHYNIIQNSVMYNDKYGIHLAGQPGGSLEPNNNKSSNNFIVGQFIEGSIGIWQEYGAGFTSVGDTVYYTTTGIQIDTNAPWGSYINPYLEGTQVAINITGAGFGTIINPYYDGLGVLAMANPNVQILGSLGWGFTNSGSATITAGSTSTNVTHGLKVAPTRVMLTPTVDTDGKRYWISDKGTSTFTITIDSTSSSNLSFDWQAQVGEG